MYLSNLKLPNNNQECQMSVTFCKSATRNVTFCKRATSSVTFHKLSKFLVRDAKKSLLTF